MFCSSVKFCSYRTRTYGQNICTYERMTNDDSPAAPAARRGTRRLSLCSSSPHVVGGARLWWSGRIGAAQGRGRAACLLAVETASQEY